jgi:hypothetical protein
MKSLFGYIKSVFTPDKVYPKQTRDQREIEEYLSQSVDLVDLERRQRKLTRKGL